MRKLSMILLMSVIATAVIVAGCTSTTTTPTSTPVTATQGTAPTQQAAAPTANNNEKTWQVNETHEGPASMHGTITLVAGGPAAGYAVYIWPDTADEDKDPALAMVRTDANGNYEIKNIPDGYYKPRIPHRAGDGGYGDYSRVRVTGDTVWDDTTQR